MGILVFPVERFINEFIHFMQLGRSVLLPLNNVFVRNTKKLKPKKYKVFSEET